MKGATPKATYRKYAVTIIIRQAPDSQCGKVMHIDDSRMDVMEKPQGLPGSRLGLR